MVSLGPNVSGELGLFVKKAAQTLGDSTGQPDWVRFKKQTGPLGPAFAGRRDPPERRIGFVCEKMCGR